MKPLSRKPVNKHKSARHFKHNVSHVKAANLAPSPMRGGFRL